MASLLRRQVVEIPVDFHGFALQDYDDMEVPLPYPEGREVSDDPPFLTAFAMRLDFASAGHTHTAELVAEVWDAEPPHEEGAPWEVQAKAQLVSVSGRLSVELVAGSVPTAVELGTGGLCWQVRARSAGRAAVARLAVRGVPHRVERYLVQFWPTRVVG